MRSEIDIEDEDAEDMQRRRQLSPSPEVDLSSPEFDDVGVDDDTAAIAPPTPSGSFSGRLVRNTESGAGGSGGRMRGQSPPLEKDEREFTLTARGMQRRRLNRSRDSGEAAFVTVEPSRATSRHDFEGELFGERHRAQTISVADSRAVEVAHSSPVVRPTTSLGLGQLSLNTAGHSPVGKEQILGKRSWEDVAEVWIRDEDQGGMWDSRSPEMVDLEELDGLFSGY